MKQIINIILSIGLLISFGSCSRMVVNVSVADSKRVQEIGDKLHNRSLAYAFTNIRSEVLSCDLFDEEKIKNLFAKDYKDGIASGFIAADDQDQLIKNLQNSIAKAVGEIREGYLNGIKLTNQQKYDNAVTQFWDAYEKAKEMKKAIDEEFDNKVYISSVSDAVTCFNITIANAVEGDRDNLLGDPLVAYITKDSLRREGLWDSKYNYTKSSTFFGNSDIAVVLQEDPESYNNNYAIKGVRVDADKLIQSGFDVLAQSINVLASSQGISLPSSSNTDASNNNYFTPEVVLEITQLSSEKNKLAAKQKEFNTYKRLLLLEILSRDLDSKNGDDLKQTIEEIKTIWASYKENIEIQSNK